MGCRLVVGLGNPGPEYDKTWHNLGFQTVRALATRLRTSVKLRSNSLLGRGRHAGHDVFLLLPQDYMNLSGLAVSRVAREQKVNADEILIIFDDHDLPKGLLRMRPSGGDGGHRGLRSIIHELGAQNVARLRVGFRDQNLDPEAGGYDDLKDRVLKPLEDDEYDHFKAMAKGASQAALDWIGLGTQVAMNRHNNRLIISPIEEKKRKLEKKAKRKSEKDQRKAESTDE